MRYALAVFLIFFLSSCETTKAPVVESCINAERVMREVAEKLDVTLFELNDIERKTFLSNLNNIPPVTDHNWPHIYGLYSPKRPTIYIMAADKDGCFVARQEFRAADFRLLVTPRGSKTSV